MAAASTPSPSLATVAVDRPLSLLLDKITQHAWNGHIAVLTLHRLDADVLPLAYASDHLICTPHQRTPTEAVRPEQIDEI